MIALSKPLAGILAIVWLFWTFDRDVSLGVMVYLSLIGAAVAAVWWVMIREQK